MPKGPGAKGRKDWRRMPHKGPKSLPAEELQRRRKEYTKLIEELLLKAGSIKKAGERGLLPKKFKNAAVLRRRAYALGIDIRGIYRRLGLPLTGTKQAATGAKPKKRKAAPRPRRGQTAPKAPGRPAPAMMGLALGAGRIKSRVSTAEADRTFKQTVSAYDGGRTNSINMDAAVLRACSAAPITSEFVGVKGALNKFDLKHRIKGGKKIAVKNLPLKLRAQRNRLIGKKLALGRLDGRKRAMPKPSMPTEAVGPEQAVSEIRAAVERHAKAKTKAVGVGGNLLEGVPRIELQKLYGLAAQERKAFEERYPATTFEPIALRKKRRYHENRVQSYKSLLEMKDRIASE